MNIYEPLTTTTTTTADIKMRTLPRWLIGKVKSVMLVRFGSTGRMLDASYLPILQVWKCRPKLSKSNACVQV